MKKRILFLSLTMAACMGTMPLYAIPANPTPRVVTQPDGTTLTVSLQGDEYGSWYVASDGSYVTLCPDGYYRYVELDAAGNPVASNRVACDVDSKDAKMERGALSSETQAIGYRLSAMRQANFEKRSYKHRPQGAPLKKIARQAAETPVEVRGIVLLVQFQDVKFSENGTVENISALMNEPGNDYMGAIGSARDYFIDQSFGKFAPSFDVIGPITVSENEAYYGENVNGADAQPYKMVIEACDIAHEQGLCDFSDYDGDGDGVVDLVFVVYAGYAESDNAPSWTIWPHASWIASVADGVYNGVTLDAYACTAELAGNTGTDLYGIGAICHEYSHTLGLPDFYDTKGGGSFGMGVWSVMDQGCHNAEARVPVGYSSLEREFCGWMQIEELSKEQTVTLPNLADYGIAYKIMSTNPDRYFMLETRTRTRWDSYLPAEGLLITKMDYVQQRWEDNEVNTVKNRQGVQFVPADNIISIATYEGDLWPYNGNDAFTESSEPPMKIYLTTIRNKPVTNIFYDDANEWVTFDFMGGTPAGELASPLALLPDIDSDNSFVAHWSAVTGATSYTILVENVLSQEQQMIENITETTYRVTGLEVGNYTYKVKAVNATTESDYSNTVELVLSAGIGDVTADDTFTAFAVHGNIMIKSDIARCADIYNVQGVLVASVSLQGGVASYSPRERGVYIVRCGKSAVKVIL